LQLIIGRLEDFAAKLHDGLEAADWASKRDLIRALVKRVEVARNEVNVVFQIDPYLGDADLEKKVGSFVRGESAPPCGVPSSVGKSCFRVSTWLGRDLTCAGQSSIRTVYARPFCDL
jgi:hypothetical protein